MKTTDLSDDDGNVNYYSLSEKKRINYTYKVLMTHFHQPSNPSLSTLFQRNKNADINVEEYLIQYCLLWEKKKWKKP